MKSKSITIGIFLSVALVVTAAWLYWMASSAKADNHYLAISTIRKIQQLESQWSIETARVRSDPMADFDALITFIPRMGRLKDDLSDAIQSASNLPGRLLNDTSAYLSAIDAKEEWIERFKTGYAVLRNSTRYLPLAASSVMQQMQERGGNTAFIHNISSVTDEINTYLATPAAPEKERLMRVLSKLGDDTVGRYPALANTIANFVAHGQVLLDKQAPTEEIFQEAISSQISDLGESLINSLESEIGKTEQLVAYYERGILASGGALWVVWLAVALQLPRDNRQRNGFQHQERAALDKIAAAAAAAPPSSLPPLPLIEPLVAARAAAPPPSEPLVAARQASPQLSPREDAGLERLTADLIRSEKHYNGETSQTKAAEFTAHRIGIEIIAEQLTALAGRINSSTDVLSDIQAQLYTSGLESAGHTPDSAAAHTPDEEPQPLAAEAAEAAEAPDDEAWVLTADDESPPLAADEELKTTAVDEELKTTAVDEELKNAAAVMSSIRAQANGIVELAERLPSLARKRDDVYALININDYIDEVVDNTQARDKALVVKDLNPIPEVFASETEIYLILANIIENSVWAVQERSQKKGVIRIETIQENNAGVLITITDNGVGIRPEKRKQVFNPFYTSRDDATGMGLTATQYMVEKYGGTILMNSLPNQGTMVRVMLPSGAKLD